MKVYSPPRGVKAVPIKAFIDEVGDPDLNTIEQLQRTAQMPFIHKHLAVMPDCHLGIGSTVGSVVATKQAIIPACVGVDIGCGMIAQKTGITAEDLPDSVAHVRSEIERTVPHGRTANGVAGKDRGSWGNLPDHVRLRWGSELLPRFERMAERYATKQHGVPTFSWKNRENHLGTLGTGNHFVELCLDEDGTVWAMLHSGSRGIGNRIAQHFIDLARRSCDLWHVDLPHQDLAYLPQGTPHFDPYIEAVEWAQDFARINREIMMDAVMLVLAKEFGGKAYGDLDADGKMTAVNCHHNYVSRENHFGEQCFVTRKGAVRARRSDLGIIPGSMGERSFIVRGKQNDDSFHSCSHGAGRVMSRTQARKTFTLEQHEAATAGVECRKDESVLDETPAAYKNIDDVMASQSDLVEVVHTLKQFLCVKG